MIWSSKEYYRLALCTYLALWRMTSREKKYSRYASGLLTYAMRFGYMGTAKVARRKWIMPFPEGKRF